MHFSYNSKPYIQDNYIHRFKVFLMMRNSTKLEAYTVDFSGGVTNGGLGYFSSNVCVIISESGTHFSSNFITGTLPSGLI